MMNHDDAFLPETIEEQIDQAMFAPSHQPLSPESHLVQELHAHYAEDRRSAARMWERLVQRVNELEGARQAQAGFPQEQQKGTDMPSFENAPTTDHAPGARRPWRHLLGLLVAALVMVLLVGSLTAVIELAHTKLSPGTASSPPVGTIIYSHQIDSGLEANPVWSPDSRYLAIDDVNSRQTRIVEALTGRTKLTIPRVGIPIWSPASDLLAIGTSSGITIFDGKTGKLVSAYTWPTSPPLVGQASTSSVTPSVSHRSFSGAGAFGFFAWSPDGKWIVVPYAMANDLDVAHGWVQVWDTRTGKPALNLVTEPGAGFEAGGAAWSSDGRYLALVLGGTVKKVQFSRVQVWDMQTRQAVFQQSLQGNNYFESATWQPGTDHLAVAADIQKGSAIQLWNIVTGKLLTSSPTSSGSMPGSLSWSPDGQYIVYGSTSNGSLVVLDVTTGQRLYTFHPGSGAVSYVNGTWSPDGKYIANLEVRLSKTTLETVVLQVWIA